MSSRVSDRAAVVIPKSKVEAEQVKTPAPTSKPAGWTSGGTKAQLAAAESQFERAQPSPPQRTLRPGMEGADVLAVQKRLRELGFQASNNGRYDAATVRAVEAFQRSRRLGVDGLAGRNTFNALGITSVATATAFTGRTLKRGMSGDDVTRLQQALRNHGQNIRVTGSYDSATERAVENFQRARGLQVDGDAGRQTQTALGLSGQPPVISQPQPQAPTRPTTGVNLGDPAQRAAIAARITIGRGTHTNAADIAAVRAEVAKLPLDQLRELERTGAKVVACRDSVVDAMPSLKGVQPRGWAPGRTWEDVPGAYVPNTKEIVVATRAGSGGTREVPRQGQGHGSVNIVAHEAAHAIDAARRYPSRSDDSFQAAYQRDLRGGQLLAYYTQAGDAGASEAYAESLAIFLSGDPTGDGAKRFPALMGYWQQQYSAGNA